jgi:hypothetical protein
MRRLTILAILVAALALPASALGATKYYAGKTEQGHKTSAKVVDGDLKWLKVTWKVNCDDEGFVLGPLRTTWIDAPQGPIQQTGTTFTDSGGGEFKRKDGHKAVFQESVAGEILAGGRIKGRQTVDARYYNAKGKEYDRCHGKIDFSLKRK